MKDFKIKEIQFDYYKGNQEAYLNFEKEKDTYEFVCFLMFPPKIEEETNEDKFFSLLLSEKERIKSGFVSIPKEERVKFSSSIFNGVEFLEMDLSSYLLGFSKKEDIQITDIYFLDDAIEIIICDEKEYTLSFSRTKGTNDEKIIIDQIDSFAKKINLEAQKIFKYIKL